MRRHIVAKATDIVFPSTVAAFRLNLLRFFFPVMHFVLIFVSTGLTVPLFLEIAVKIFFEFQFLVWARQYKMRG